jgi:hypothetical protein
MLTDFRRPWAIQESVNPSNQVPLGQFVPVFASQNTYNAGHFFPWGGACAQCDDSYIATWPVGAVPTFGGSGALVFADINVIDGLFFNHGFPQQTDLPPDGGTIVYPWSGSGLPTATQTVSDAQIDQWRLWAPNERRYSRAWLDDSVTTDGSAPVYAFKVEEVRHGDRLRVPLSAGQQNITQLELREPLAEPVLPGQLLEIVDGDRRQVVIVAAPPAGTAPNVMNGTRAHVVKVHPFTANAAYTANNQPRPGLALSGAVVQHLGNPLGTLAVGLTQNQSVSQLKLVDPLPLTLPQGYKLELIFATGDKIQIFELSQQANKGTTTLNVVPAPANFGYAPGFSAVYQALPGNIRNGLDDPYGFETVVFVARARWDSVRNRSAWSFWNQRAQNFQGGWDTNSANATPMQYTDGRIDVMDVPSVRFSPYLGRYLSIGGKKLNDGVYVSTSSSPIGPWTPPVLITENSSAGEGPGTYFTVEHPEMRLGNGQQIYVSYNRNVDIGLMPVWQITLPPPNQIP